MGRENVIVYGLGENYGKYIDDIKNIYNVIGVSDRQVVIREDYIKPEHLTHRSEKIMVTCSDVRSVSYDLVVNRGVSPHRILFWKYVIYSDKIKNQDILTFSQFCEDMYISSILRDKNIVLGDVKYIEVGVENPIQSSNTYLFQLKGGSGILVDANPECIPLIKVIRQNQLVLNKAVCDQKGNVTFYINENSWRSSLDKGKIVSEGYRISKEVSVEAISINELLSMQPDTNVLSIDIEGYDEKTLYEIDYNLFHPDVICAEVGNPNKELLSHMKSCGYGGVINNTINTIWF